MSANQETLVVIKKADRSYLTSELVAKIPVDFTKGLEMTVFANMAMDVKGSVAAEVDFTKMKDLGLMDSNKWRAIIDAIVERNKFKHMFTLVSMAAETGNKDRVMMFLKTEPAFKDKSWALETIDFVSKCTVQYVNSASDLTKVFPFVKLASSYASIGMIGLVLIHESTDYKTYVKKSVFAQMFTNKKLATDAREGLFILWESIKATKNANRAKNIEFGLIQAYADTTLSDACPFLRLTMEIYQTTEMDEVEFENWAKEILLDMAGMKYEYVNSITAADISKSKIEIEKVDRISLLQFTFDSYVSECSSVRKANLETLRTFLTEYPTAAMIYTLEYSRFPKVATQISLDQMSQAIIEISAAEMMEGLTRFKSSVLDNSKTYLILEEFATETDLRVKAMIDKILILEVGIALYIEKIGNDKDKIPKKLLDLIVDPSKYQTLTNDQKQKAITDFVAEWIVTHGGAGDPYYDEYILDIQSHVDGSIDSFDDYVNSSQLFIS